MRLSISWDAERSRWERLFARVPQSNVLQSWCYGEAKRIVGGWKVRRGVIGEDGRPVALVQALSRRFMGLPGILRVNRGPLWLTEVPDMDGLEEAFAVLRRGARWWRGCALSIAPELSAGKPSDHLLRGLGYRRLPAPCFRSLCVDLAHPAARLHRGLRHNWRKQLAISERANVKVVADSGDAAFEWLLARHETVMSERGYSGLSAAFLRAMRAARTRTDQFIVLRATLQEEWIGGVLVFTHGSCATYLVGWNGPDGRKVNAHNALLWEALCDAQRRKCRWFDLNHIDETGPAGIASFKRGMGGTEYELAGEFVCF